MDYQTFLLLVAPLLIAIGAVALAVSALYALCMLAAWVWLHFRYWLWRHRNER